MEVFKILEQLALLPIKVAQGMIDFVRKGHVLPINMTATVDGKKVGAETRIFLFEDEGKKQAVPGAQPPAS